MMSLRPGKAGKGKRKMDTLKIGRYIQYLRKAAGMTQKELADKLGISFQSVSKWENGLRGSGAGTPGVPLGGPRRVGGLLGVELLITKFRLKLKKVGKITRTFRYDLNQIPYDYTVEVSNRFKGLDLIDRVPDELWNEVRDIVQETGIKTIPMEKKCKKA